MKLEHAFEVPTSPEATMELMLDAERVVPCMPGAELVEVDDTDPDAPVWKSTMSVKLGPVGMSFANNVTLLGKDEASHTVTLGVSGRDTRGKGGAEGTVVSTLTALEAGGTRVEIVTDIRFSGQAAQLGRPNVVRDVSNRMVGQFAECIAAQLAALSEPEREGSAEAAAAARERAKRPVSGLSLIIAALTSALKRLFRRDGARRKGKTA